MPNRCKQTPSAQGRAPHPQKVARDLDSKPDDDRDLKTVSMPSCSTHTGRTVLSLARGHGSGVEIACSALDRSFIWQMY